MKQLQTITLLIHHYNAVPFHLQWTVVSSIVTTASKGGGKNRSASKCLLCQIQSKFIRGREYSNICSSKSLPTMPLKMLVICCFLVMIIAEKEPKVTEFEPDQGGGIRNRADNWIRRGSAFFPYSSLERTFARCTESGCVFQRC